jgi:hypothetical protein
MSNDNGMNRVASFNGQRWEMGEVAPEVFLSAALVPHFPDLRGATYTRVEGNNEVVYDFHKQVGEKG